MNTLKEVLWYVANILFWLKFSPTNLGSNLHQLLLRCVPSDNFLFPSFFLYLLNGILWKSPFSPIFLFKNIYYICISMDLGIFIYPIIAHLFAQVVMALAIGSSFGLAPVSFQHMPFFWKFLTFWHYKIFQGHFIFSLLQFWNIVSFIEKWYLATKI